jgi:hypothetical protein
LLLITYSMLSNNVYSSSLISILLFDINVFVVKNEIYSFSDKLN